MESFFSRTDRVFPDASKKAPGLSAAVFGLGGVGSFCTEALARFGIGRLIVCDGDTVAESNLNRQLYALKSTVGQNKTDVCAARIADINPDCEVIRLTGFISPETDFSFLNGCSYVADCIDDVKAKISLVSYCKAHQIPVISALGCGNRRDPSKLCVTDIYSTSGCPLARSVRTNLRKAGIEALDVVFSNETPVCSSGASGPGSVSFVPSAAGLLMASHIINKLFS